MKRLALLSVPFFLATPALAADLDGPVYSEREIYIERPAPPRVVEYRRYYSAPPPVVYYYDDEPAYGYRYYARPYVGYNHWRPAYYYPRWRHHRHRW